MGKAGFKGIKRSGEMRRKRLVEISLFSSSSVLLSYSLTYSLYGLFTVLHLYANYRAVRAVCMETLNRARLRLVFHHFLLQGKVLGPVLANPREPLLPGN